MPVIKLNGKSITYRVRKSKRAKRVFLNLSRGKGLEVVYPVGVKATAPEELLRQKREWILAGLDRLNSGAAKAPAREYKEGEVFPLRGVPYRLKLLIAPGQDFVEVQPGAGILTVRRPPDARREHILDAIVGFYRQNAKIYLPRRLDELAERYGFDYNQVRIKNQKTRWGSCSNMRNINLNLRLMMAPDEAIDYVLIHELCHLRELNHTPAFWALVETYCPDFRRWEAWFDENGPSLVL